MAALKEKTPPECANNLAKLLSGLNVETEIPENSGLDFSSVNYKVSNQIL